MKKHILLHVVSIFLLQISGFALGMVQGLESVKQDLVKAKQQVIQANKQIRDTYTEIQTNVVNKLDAAISGVDKQADALNKSIKDLNDVPKKNLVLGLAMIPDLDDALNWMVGGPIKVIKNTLSDIKTGFADVNVDLDPKTDPKGVYANFEASKKNFDKAIAELDKLIAALKAF